ncbi:hypothetical protein P170DRAFT_470267 [Aspergillus steynii IBT 23096]|uniref:Uncharacterized protein n=1 Tax=Aspergillus steynii IBT 23096 TaxID=1392250 RepID=A0A2I2GPM1_9EURO|nr:uncharacterized protein P170DRAFT_470267 [Aspergillus steynii IBT 23096]PLB54827.1 hypothetical protein P170DRAFT_470267 [Aspergillus steynii IBT 23096]
MKLSIIFSASFLAALAVAAPAPARAGTANIPAKRQEGVCPPGTVWEYPDGDDEVGGCVVDHSAAKRQSSPCPAGQHYDFIEGVKRSLPFAS